MEGKREEELGFWEGEEEGFGGNLAVKETEGERSWEGDFWRRNAYDQPTDSISVGGTRGISMRRFLQIDCWANP